MKTFILVGRKADNTNARIGTEVRTFTDKDNNFVVSYLDTGSIQLVTAKGTYTLQKHPVLNIYSATLNGHKVQVSLKAISGWLKFW